MKNDSDYDNEKALIRFYCDEDEMYDDHRIVCDDKDANGDIGVNKSGINGLRNSEAAVGRKNVDQEVTSETIRFLDYDFHNIDEFPETDLNMPIETILSDNLGHLVNFKVGNNRANRLTKQTLNPGLKLKSLKDRK